MVEVLANRFWVQAVSLNPGPDSNLLWGAACSSATNCFVVGAQFTTTSTSPLVERWNGTTMSVVPSVEPPGTDSELRAVTCANAADCTAVGVAERLPWGHTLVEHWDGSHWSVVPTPSTPNRLG